MKQIKKNTAPTERVQKTKQILAVILSLLLVFGLAACRSSRQTSAQTDTTQSNVAMETTEAKKTGAVEDFVKRFSEYFFSGNTEELRKCLAAGYQGAADGYTGETASDISVRTIAPIDDDNHLLPASSLLRETRTASLIFPWS